MSPPQMMGSTVSFSTAMGALESNATRPLSSLTATTMALSSGSIDDVHDPAHGSLVGGLVRGHVYGLHRDVGRVAECGQVDKGGYLAVCIGGYSRCSGIGQPIDATQPLRQALSRRFVRSLEVRL